MVYSIIFLIIYLIILIYLGYRGYKETKGLSDFAASRGAFGPIVMGICMASTAISAVVFLGFPGWAYVGGTAVLWNTALFWPAMALGMFVFARKFRRTGEINLSLTVPDWLGNRFQSDAIRLIGAILGLWLLFHIGGQIMGIGYLFLQMLKIPYTWAIILGSVIVAGYIILGGMRSDVWTDAFQGTVMAIIAAILFGTALYVTGGFGSMISKLAAQDQNLVRVINPKFIIFGEPLAPVFHGLFAFGFTLLPYIANKYFVIKRERDLVTMILTFSICTFFYYMMLFVGLAGRAEGLKVLRPDQITPVFVSAYFHPVMAPIIILAILCAAMSTVDGLYHSVASIFAVDVYQRILVKRGIVHKGRSAEDVERIGLLLSRILVVVIAIGILIWVWKPPMYIALMSTIGLWGYLSGLIPVILLGLFWRGITKVGAIAGLVTGTIVFAIILIFKLVPYLSVWTQAGIGLACSFAATIGLSLVTKSTLPPEEITNKYVGA